MVCTDRRPSEVIEVFNGTAPTIDGTLSDNETLYAPTNLHVDETILGMCNYVPVRWDMTEINDFSHFNVYVNSEQVTNTTLGTEVILDVESNDMSGKESEKSETLTFHVGNINVEGIAVNVVNLYPNPATSVVYIESDMIGRLVKRTNISDIQNTSINVEDLQSGLYFFMIQQDNLIIVRKLSIK